MRKMMFLMVSMILASSILITGCSKEGTVASSMDAIDIAKTLATTQEKISYLTTEAETLYRSEKFQDVANIAQYILTYLDGDSQIAENLLNKAKTKLVEMAQKKATDLAENKLNSFGK